MKWLPIKNVIFYINCDLLFFILDIPLKITLEILNLDFLADIANKEGTIVEPQQLIRFRCITEGRPKPSVFYTWLLFNNTDNDQV